MSDSKKDIILEYKDQIRILREEVAELQDAGKTKDAANKRCLQKLENTDEDLDKANKEIDSVRHNHTYNTNKLGVSAVAYLTQTNFGTVFGDSDKIKPQVNTWNIFDSRLYHQAEKGITNKDRYVLAFDVFIDI